MSCHSGPGGRTPGTGHGPVSYTHLDVYKRQVLAHLRGELSLEECRRLWLHNTRAYAKRQRTWFRARSEARFFAPQDLDGLLAAARQAC